MTATRDRRPEAEPDPAETPWDERPILGVSRGLTWWAAVSLAFGLAMVAAVFDVLRTGTLGQPYQIGYVAGSVAAVCWVRRHSLFGPMVQAPLVFAITAVGSLLVFGGGSGSGLKQLLFSVVLPLTSNFPTMAVTTAITVGIGLFRIWYQRDPEPEVRRVRADRDEEQAGRLGRRTGGRGAAGGRTPPEPGDDGTGGGGPGGESGYGERSRRGRDGRTGSARAGADRGGATPGGRTNTARGDRAGRDRQASGGRPWDRAGGAAGRGGRDQPPRGAAREQAAPGPDGDHGQRRPRPGESSEARRDRSARGGRGEVGRPDPRSQRGREATPPRYSGEREPRSRRDTSPRRRPDDHR